MYASYVDFRPMMSVMDVGSIILYIEHFPPITHNCYSLLQIETEWHPEMKAHKKQTCYREFHNAEEIIPILIPQRLRRSNSGCEQRWLLMHLSIVDSNAKLMMGSM